MEEPTGSVFSSLPEAGGVARLVGRTLAFEAEGRYGSPVYTWRFQGPSRADTVRLKRACEQVE